MRIDFLDKFLSLPRQANAVANSLLESAKRDKMDIFDIDLDLKVCHITWGQMFGPFKPYLSNTTTTSAGRLKYLLSDQDGVAQKILSWINMGIISQPFDIYYEFVSKKQFNLIFFFLFFHSTE